MEKFTAKLHKLSSGDLAAAAAMSTRKLSKAEQKDTEEEGLDEDLDEDLGDGIGGMLDSAADMDWVPDSSRLPATDPRRPWRSRSRSSPFIMLEFASSA